MGHFGGLTRKDGVHNSRSLTTQNNTLDDHRDHCYHRQSSKLDHSPCSKDIFDRMTVERIDPAWTQTVQKNEKLRVSMRLSLLGVAKMGTRDDIWAY